MDKARRAISAPFSFVGMDMELRAEGQFRASEPAWFAILNWRNGAFLAFLLIVTVLGSTGNDNRPSATPFAAAVLTYLPLVLVIALWFFFLWRLTGAQKRAGLPDSYPVAFVLDEQGFGYSSPVGTVGVPWSAILKLVATRRYWVIHGPGIRYLMPRRFFANPADDRAFAAFAVEHLTSQARARSAAAVRFATN